MKTPRRYGDSSLKRGAEASAFDDSITSDEGLRECRAIAADVEQRGVFGVPTFLLQETGELFWGTDRVWLLRERLLKGRSEQSCA